MSRSKNLAIVEIIGGFLGVNSRTRVSFIHKYENVLVNLDFCAGLICLFILLTHIEIGAFLS